MRFDDTSDPDLFRRLHANNLRRQYDLLDDLIDIGIVKGLGMFDTGLIWALNHAAVAGLSRFAGGRFREEPVHTASMQHPHFTDVPRLMDRFVGFVHENGGNMTATHLAAYGLWRIGWIHPFFDGNGRTARAVAYFLYCVRSGLRPGGRKALPQRLREQRERREAGLQEGNRLWDEGIRSDTSLLDQLVADLIRLQIADRD